VGGRVEYAEGLNVGYRWYGAKGIAPLFPFGFGLSYTRFRFSHLRVAQVRGGAVSVSADVTNSGGRAGAEVVQLYVGAPAATGEPPWQLKGFRKLRLAPHQTARLTFQLPRRAFAQWDEAAGDWSIGAGSYRIGVGDSAAELPLTGAVTPRPGPAGTGGE